MKKEIIFSSDYIEILTKDYDTIIYTPVFSVELGLYLSSEGEKPFKDILLFNSNMIINYMDGRKKLLGTPLISVSVNDVHFRRKTNNSICGTLFKYSVNDAQLYDLENEKSINYIISDNKKLKRSL